MMTCLGICDLVAWLAVHELGRIFVALLLGLAVYTIAHRAGFRRGYEHARRLHATGRIVPDFYEQQGD